MNNGFWYASTIEEAKQLLFNYDCLGEYHSRWIEETKFTDQIIRKYTSLTSDTNVLDYGCGIGRMGKYLAERYDCFVDGVDISPSLLQLGSKYTTNPKVRFFSDIPNKKYDLALFLWSACVIDDRFEVLNRVSKHLADDAFIIMIDRKHGLKQVHDHDWRVDFSDLLSDSFLSVYELVDRGSLPSNILLDDWSYQNSEWLVGKKKK